VTFLFLSQFFIPAIDGEFWLLWKIHSGPFGHKSHLDLHLFHFLLTTFPGKPLMVGFSKKSVDYYALFGWLF